MNFPFNQPDNTRDCGYRCAHYAATVTEDYETWIKEFRFFSPEKSGIYFNDICDILSYYKKEYKFTELSENGLYIVYSGVWLHSEGKKHGHYFVYHFGNVMCSTHNKPYKMKLSEVVKRLEAKTVDHAYRSLLVG